MIDTNFPIINYHANETPNERGHNHGESFRLAIRELIEIRRDLMLAKNPALKSNIQAEAKRQLEVSRKFAPDLVSELEGIAAGAHSSVEDIVILNNYTDFRDIEMPEEGCSTLVIKRDDVIWAGQTWDMHGSAKNYVNIINIEQTENKPAMLVFSLVGCLGMMGYNSDHNMIGVNNINTLNAKSGLIWPILIRKVLEENTIEKMRNTLTNAPVTSGHNYMLASKNGEGEHWEITPEVSERVLQINNNDRDEVFHTNHCLGEKVRELENQKSLSSTTFCRFDLLSKKISAVNSFQEAQELLTNHDEYPKSICSHFESNSQDPSLTCGGALGDYSNDYYSFWRGCPVHDKNYIEYSFKLDGNFHKS